MGTVLCDLLEGLLFLITMLRLVQNTAILLRLVAVKIEKNSIYSNKLQCSRCTVLYDMLEELLFL